MLSILYLHGLRSRPGGVKPSFLKGKGFDVINPALPDDDFGESVRRAQEAFDAGRPAVVVGSSRGGAVALNMDTASEPVVLIAPAWKKWGSATTAGPTTVILHSATDDVIPLIHSEELIDASDLPRSALIVVGADHNMTDLEAFDALFNVVRRALENRAES
jgi:hypothetical protein